MGAGRWRVAGASVRGAGHEKTGQPCQDVADWEILPDGTLVVVLADGAGSAPWGQLGAERSVRAAIEAVRQQRAFSAACPAAGLLPSAQPEGGVCRQAPTVGSATTSPGGEPAEAVRERLLADAVRAARSALEAEAQQRNLPLRDLATTLIVVLADDAQVGVAQVGDGAVVVATGGGELQALSLPPPTEYLNETVFLVSPDWLPRLQLRVWSGKATGLAVMSDGLQMLALRMPAGIPHAPFFHPLFRFVSQSTDRTEAAAELTRWLGSAGVRRRTDDDVSLVVAVPEC